MSLIYSKESVCSDSFSLSSQVIQTSRHLKALWNVELHKRRIKSIVRIIFETICNFYSEKNLRQVVEKSKKKIRVISVVENTSQNFSFDWVMNSVLITSTAKKFLHQIENFRKSSIYNKFLHKNDHILFIENKKKSQVIFIEKQKNFFSLFISTRILSVNRSTSKENSTFVSLNITQESSFVSRNTVSGHVPQYC